MPAAADKDIQIQMAHFAQQCKSAMAADRVIVICGFYDEDVGADATLLAFADDTDKSYAEKIGEITHALMSSAQTAFSETNVEVVLRNKETGELREFNVIDPHAVSLDEDEDDCEALKAQLKTGLEIFDEYMAQIGICVSQDYAKLNQFPIDCAALGVTRDG